MTGFEYHTGDLWRNFGIVIAFFIFFQVLQMGAIEYTQSIVMPSIVIFEREDAERKKLNERLMERKEAAKRGELEQDLKGLIKTKRPFTWEALSYTVPVSGGQRKLLNDVYGYVKPGTLTALMGASGAGTFFLVLCLLLYGLCVLIEVGMLGKTTLLDVLAMRKNIGVISGDVLVAGKPLGIDFQRGTAYCEQQDGQLFSVRLEHIIPLY